jgi:hypothetical protein
MPLFGHCVVRVCTQPALHTLIIRSRITAAFGLQGVQKRNKPNPDHKSSVVVRQPVQRQTNSSLALLRFFISVSLGLSKSCWFPSLETTAPAALSAERMSGHCNLARWRLPALRARFGVVSSGLQGEKDMHGANARIAQPNGITFDNGMPSRDRRPSNVAVIVSTSLAGSSSIPANNTFLLCLLPLRDRRQPSVPAMRIPINLDCVPQAKYHVWILVIASSIRETPCSPGMVNDR